MGDLRPWEDPDHPGNAIRPDVRCLGCGVMGSVTYWGPWCLACNVAWIKHLDQRWAAVQEARDGPAFVVVRARDVKPYHFGLWSSVHGGPPFANPIADVSWSDDGTALWLGLESHNFKRVAPDDLLELVDLRGDRLLADSQARYADWVLPAPGAPYLSPFSSFSPY